MRETVNAYWLNPKNDAISRIGQIAVSIDGKESLSVTDHPEFPDQIIEFMLNAIEVKPGSYELAMVTVCEPSLIFKFILSPGRILKPSPEAFYAASVFMSCGLGKP